MSADGLTRAPAARPGQRGRKLHWISGFVAVIGLVVSLILAAVVQSNYQVNEHRLTVLQASLGADALATIPSEIQRFLGKPVSLAAATGDPSQFAATMAPQIGQPKSPFVDAELFQVKGDTFLPVVRLGGGQLIPPADLMALTAQARQSPTFAVKWVKSGTSQRFGFAMAVTGRDGTYVDYAEQRLPGNHRFAFKADSPLSALYASLYFGHTVSPASLIETNAPAALKDQTATASVALGNQTLTLVVAPRDSLAGLVSEYLSWAIILLGLILTGGSVVVTEGLTRRREAAENLAAENRRLYQAQREVAETLQRSLLPDQLPDHPELDVAVRYRPGTEGIEVGGDWYDVIDVGDDTVFFTVGDVAGTGLHAATLMGSLRSAINAYAIDGATPEEIFNKVSHLVDVVETGRFATILCGRVDLRTGHVRMACAGHLPPVLVTADGAEVLHVQPGPPVGIEGSYQPTEFTLPVGATLTAFTDGLVERRGESLEVGLDRLRSAAAGDTADELADRLLSNLADDGQASDDIAILAMRRAA